MAVQAAPPKSKRKTAPRPPRKVKSALADFQRRALELFPDDILAIILYGSYARGEATPDSDVDVMVVGKWTDPRQADLHYSPGLGDPPWEQREKSDYERYVPVPREKAVELLSDAEAFIAKMKELVGGKQEEK